MGNFILMVDRFLCDCASIFMLTIVLFLLNTFDVPNFCTNLLVIFVPVFYLALNFYLTIEYCHDECASKYGCEFYDSHLIFTMIYYFIVPIPMFCFFTYLITDSMFSVPHLIMFFCSGYFTLTPSLLVGQYFAYTDVL